MLMVRGLNGYLWTLEGIPSKFKLEENLELFVEAGHRAYYSANKFKLKEKENLELFLEAGLYGATKIKLEENLELFLDTCQLAGLKLC